MAFAITAAVVGAVGTAYASNQASKAQQKAANIQNARERKEQLKAIGMAQRSLEFQGAASGTGGGSSQAQATGPVASTGATNIGAQMQTIAAANQVSHWNRMGSGFGALSSLSEVLPAIVKKDDQGLYIGNQRGKG